MQHAWNKTSIIFYLIIIRRHSDQISKAERNLRTNESRLYDEVYIPSGWISRRKSFLVLLVPRDRSLTPPHMGRDLSDISLYQDSLRGRLQSPARDVRRSLRLLFHPGLGFLRSVTHATRCVHVYMIICMTYYIIPTLLIHVWISEWRYICTNTKVRTYVRTYV